MRCVFDTNIWIYAYEGKYAIDMLLDILARAIRAGIIVSPSGVIDELKNSDEVKEPEHVREWVIQHREWLEAPLREDGFDAKIEREVERLSNTYRKLAVPDNDADYYVVAWGKVLGIPVITGEKGQGTAQRDNYYIRKIPDVCEKEKMDCYSFLEFAWKQGWISESQFLLLGDASPVADKRRDKKKKARPQQKPASKLF
ncbi:MAG: DUF4411 family protein [Gammaproteobacteria bacterium]